MRPSPRTTRAQPSPLAPVATIPSKPLPKVGDTVSIRWHDHGLFFPGRLCRRLQDLGAFIVAYDDGDRLLAHLDDMYWRLHTQSSTHHNHHVITYEPGELTTIAAAAATLSPKHPPRVKPRKPRSKSQLGRKRSRSGVQHRQAGLNINSAPAGMLTYTPHLPPPSLSPQEENLVSSGKVVRFPAKQRYKLLHGTNLEVSKKPVTGRVSKSALERKPITARKTFIRGQEKIASKVLEENSNGLAVEQDTGEQLCLGSFVSEDPGQEFC